MDNDVNTTQYFEETKANLVELFSLESLPKEEQEQTIARMMALITDESITRILEVMTPEEVEALNEFMGSEPNEQEVLKYLLENVEGFPLVVEQVSMELIRDGIAILDIPLEEDTKA